MCVDSVLTREPISLSPLLSHYIVDCSVSNSVQFSIKAAAPKFAFIGVKMFDNPWPIRLKFFQLFQRCVVASVTLRPSHEHNIKASASWVTERPKEGPRAKTKRVLSRGPSEDIPDTAFVQVLKRLLPQLEYNSHVRSHIVELLLKNYAHWQRADSNYY